MDMNKIGFFRPIIPDGKPDNSIQLIRDRYDLDIPVEAMYGYRHGEAQHMVAAGQYNTLLKNIFGKYKALESRCNFVLGEGTDYTGAASAFEFDFNADVANNLACPVLAVVSGRDKSSQQISEEIEFARKSFESHGCTMLSIIANPEVALRVRIAAGEVLGSTLACPCDKQRPARTGLTWSKVCTNWLSFSGANPAAKMVVSSHPVGGGGGRGS